MNNPAHKGGFAGKLWVKILALTILAMIVICGLLWANALWGNPISKQAAKSRCMGYYQDQYQELFIVHEISYWPKLPGYILTLSPEKDPGIQFTCNPNCDTLCYSDEYGGLLASQFLVEQISQILELSYGNLAIQITAAEDPFTQYGGENPDYFETDPRVRLTKNHQDLHLSWTDPILTLGEFQQTAQDILNLIETNLPFINPYLGVTVSVFPDESSHTVRYEANYTLFPTLNLGE